MTKKQLIKLTMNSKELTKIFPDKVARLMEANFIYSKLDIINKILKDK